MLVRLNTETCTSLSSKCFCSDSTAKAVISFCVSFRRGAVEAGHAVDVETERGLPGLLGIWKLPSKPPRIRLTRVSGSMMSDR